MLVEFDDLGEEVTTLAHDINFMLLDSGGLGLFEISYCVRNGHCRKVGGH